MGEIQKKMKDRRARWCTIDALAKWGDRLWEGFRESRRCSRHTYLESYITDHIIIYEVEINFTVGTC
jgi:hypothetical protein